jgi:hypothetical protein
VHEKVRRKRLEMRSDICPTLSENLNRKVQLSPLLTSKYFGNIYYAHMKNCD